MTYELHHGDARHVSDLLEPGSVDLIVTSPPYFALRSYQDGGEHYDGQIGSEPTPTEFLDALVACTADWMKVMRPGGSIWVNLGDKYSGSGGNNNSNLGERATLRGPSSYSKASDVPAKSLMGLPWRYAIRCVDELGLILRAEVIWSKPNGLPESVTDRVRRSHEQWFHFALQPRYFAAVDEVREPHATTPVGLAATFKRPAPSHDLVPGQVATQHRSDRADVPAANPLGKLPGSVWTVPTEPLQVPDSLGVDHFAAFPSEWPRRIILGWSPSGYCTACGEPRRPVVHKELEHVNNTTHAKSNAGKAIHASTASRSSSVVARESATITGYACDCPTTDAPTRPAVVLDPFGGTGTVAGVAHALGRHGVHIDLSHDYLRLAKWRIEESNLVARAQERTGIKVPQPAAIDGQMDLFGGAA
jgi:DNA modification methylase